MVQQVIKTSYETAVECLNTNFYGVQRLTEALLPLLQLSPSGARIVNVSSLRGELWVSAAHVHHFFLFFFDGESTDSITLSHIDTVAEMFIVESCMHKPVCVAANQ